MGVRADTSGVHQGPPRPELTVDYSTAREPGRAGRGERRRRRPEHRFLLGGGGAPISAAAELLRVSKCATLVPFPPIWDRSCLMLYFLVDLEYGLWVGGEERGD